MRALRWTAAVASVALVLGGCGDDDATDGDATTTTEVAVPEPEVGECRGPIDQSINSSETDSRPTVPCDQPHGSETAAVLDLPEDLQDATHDEAVAGFDSDEPPFDDLLAQCIDATDELWGATLPTSDQVITAGQFGTSMFLPTAEEWEAGARWLRCDAVIQPANETAAMASTQPFAGVAAQPVIPPEFRSCIALDPGGPVPCTEPHVGEFMALILDFDVDLAQWDVANEGERELLFFQLQQLYEPQCQAAINSAVGAERADISVDADFPRDRARAESDIESVGAVRVGCYAITGQPRTGTLAGLGTAPL